MRLTRHIYQVCGRNDGSHQNIYVIEAQSSLVLIDTGLNQVDLHIVLDNIARWHLDEKPIKAVLLTHEHYEHIGNASFFQKQGALIYAHVEAQKHISLAGNFIMAYAYPELEPCPLLSVDRVVRNNDVLSLDNLRIAVIDAPGHSKGSVLYELTIDDVAAVFSGDTVLVTEACHKAAFGRTSAIDYNEAVYLDTLKRLSVHTADILLPGHGEICMRGASHIFVGAYLRSRLDFHRDHHKDYLENAEVVYANQR